MRLTVHEDSILDLARRIILDNPLYVSGDDDMSDMVAVASMVIDRMEDDMAPIPEEYGRLRGMRS